MVTKLVVQAPNVNEDYLESIRTMLEHTPVRQRHASLLFISHLFQSSHIDIFSPPLSSTWSRVRGSLKRCVNTEKSFRCFQKHSPSPHLLLALAFHFLNFLFASSLNMVKHRLQLSTCWLDCLLLILLATLYRHCRGDQAISLSSD